MKQKIALEKVISPLVEALGFTWVGLQYFPAGRRSILRLFVDKPGGLTIDECALVSRQINAALSVENFWKDEAATLEVSSPGLDRVLFTPEQCLEQLGKLITVRVLVPRLGQKNFKGIVKRVEGNTLCLLVDESEVVFTFTEISEARVVPLW